MSPYVIDDNNKKNCVYDLYGVINHIGNSLYLGHYTAFARTHHKKDTTTDEIGYKQTNKKEIKK